MMYKKSVHTQYILYAQQGTCNSELFIKVQQLFVTQVTSNLQKSHHDVSIRGNLLMMTILFVPKRFWFPP